MSTFAVSYTIAGHWTAAPVVELSTTLGDITIALQPELAPTTVANWLNYVDSGFFDGLIFHRVIDGFMVQGGGFEPGLVPQETASAIALESNTGLLNARGSIAMARTSAPDSATSQFFINTVDNDFLNYNGDRSLGYAVFGEVISGMTNVVDKITAVPTTTVGSYGDVPVADVVITSAQKTDAGAVTTATGVIELPFQDAGTWAYSLDAGGTWMTGQGDQLTLDTGTYASGDVLLRPSAEPSMITLLPAITVVDKAPAVRISSDDDALLWSDRHAELSFVLSEASTNFDVSDIEVLGATLSDFSGSGSHYTATLTANDTTGRDIVVRVPNGVFSNAAGQSNLAAGDGLETLTLRADSVLTTASASQVVNAINAANPSLNVAAPPTSAALLMPSGEWLDLPQVTLSADDLSTNFTLRPDVAPMATASWLAYGTAGAYTGTYIDALTSYVAVAGRFNAEGKFQTPLVSPVPLASDNGLSNQFGSLALLPATSSEATNGFVLNLQNNAGADYNPYTQPPQEGWTVFAQASGDTSALSALASAPVDANDVPSPYIQLSGTLTQPGTVRSLTGEVVLGGLNDDSRWSVSLDSGLSWQTGQGATLNLPAGTFQAQQIQLKVLDGNGDPTDAVTSTLPHQVLSGAQAQTWAQAEDVDVEVHHRSDGPQAERPVTSHDRSAIDLSDVLAALKVYLGKPTGQSEYEGLQALAADLDGSGVVDLSDVLNLLKTYLGKPTDAAYAPEWVFLNADQVNDQAPSNFTTADGHAADKNHSLPPAINWVSAAAEPIQLIGVLRGDVDGSWQPAQS